MASRSKTVRRTQVAVVTSAVVLVASLGLTSCKASVVVDYHYTTSDGVVRCATGQAAVGETADQTNAGSIIALGETKAMRDLFCSNSDNLSPMWNRLGVFVELFKQRTDGSSFLCADSNYLYVTTTSGSVNRSIANRCGEGNYFSVGTHSYIPNYGPGSGTWHNFNTLTPLAYNA